ncbi:enoyl-CoA hydratase/isomerase family protein [Paenibacillus ehimensis]|uniref:Enoyl-CoA hydratase/isomerase family protein n=1 Tax=Paenibacillus ehimensis TaxID=79264 RepID=A0ABT8VD76_9BACL|nr:enoyl-CoA hydratase/isomerase family protein [Paenibacillus ehimensis]MDO3678948.1 enoyl-CoA hydratase/isomerase family protein [Paenibacillus ehimensis]
MRSYTYLQVAEQDRVFTVTIRREEKLNAMNREMMAELTDCFGWLHRQDQARAVILTGTGKAFMAGADIEGYNGFDMGQFFAFQDQGREMYRSIESCGKPVIAAVNGYALGGGFELALACDLIVASEKAKFGLPEVKLGLVPGGGGIQKIARAIGPYAAKELTMTGQFVTAAEGRIMQFVHQVTEPEALLETALKLAQDIAAQAPLAVQALKKLINEGRDASLETAQAYDRAYLASLFHSEDAKEGIAAFVAKRPPQFRGR